MAATDGAGRRTIYIPYMCDHVYALGAALTAMGVPNEVLPPPDEETLAIGLDLCKGRECLPCFTTTGDLIRRARQPGFDASRAAFFMPTTTGSCRFGQYHVLQREILSRFGFGEVRLVSPSAVDNYVGLGNDPIRLRQLCWQGVVAVDLLQKLLHEYRPYELNPGQTDRLYADCLQRIVASVRAGGGRELLTALQWVAAQFAALSVDRREHRPVIGVVGEIYIRFNAFSNGDVVGNVEAAGGQVALASMMEWLYFTNGWGYREYNWPFWSFRDILTSFLTDAYQRYEERRLTQPVAHLLTHPDESPIATLLDHLRPYYSPALNTEAILSMGKAIDFAHHGLCGIVNIMPFSCMPGLITAAMAPRLRADLDGIPWLDVICDAQSGTNIRTRLEAFMYQALQFQRRRSATAPAAGGGRP